jgi:hypothetical protein
VIGVERYGGLTRLRLLRVVLEKSSSFGNHILFMPKLKLFDFFGDEAERVAKDLLRRAAEARREMME